MLCLRLNSEIEGALLQLPGGDEPVWGPGYVLQRGEGEPGSWTVPGVGKGGKGPLQEDVNTGSRVVLTYPSAKVQEQENVWPAHTSDLVKSAALDSSICLERGGHEFWRPVREWFLWAHPCSRYVEESRSKKRRQDARS